MGRTQTLALAPKIFCRTSALLTIHVSKMKLCFLCKESSSLIPMGLSKEFAMAADILSLKMPQKYRMRTEMRLHGGARYVRIMSADMAE
jgi:hypothetical protein